MDLNLSKLQEMVEDRGTWHAPVHGVTELYMTQQLNNNIKSGPKTCTQKDLFNQKYLNEMFQVGSIQLKQILNLENPNKISAH